MSEDIKMDESHFESLGLTIENGRPKFKINEPGSIPMFSKIAKFEPARTTTDESDDLSFVVLDKSSLNSIQKNSMASYVQLKEKSNSVDCSLMLASLSPAEIEGKLTALLKENMRLKETLMQNNMAMKQQFNTLACWQEEVMRVQKSHKQKFAETRELINRLKDENAQLKLDVIAKMQSTSQANDDVGDEQTVPALALSNLSFESTSTFTSGQNEQNVPEKSLTSSNPNSSTSTSINKEISQDVGLAQEKLENEVDQLEGLISSLKQQLDISGDTAFVTVDISVGQSGDEPISQNRQTFVQSVKDYDGKLKSLNDSFTAQSSRILQIQQHLKDCWQLLDKLTIAVDEPQRQRLLEQLQSYRKIFMNEEMTNISERQTMLLAQKQFQKIFSDYNSVVCDMEILEGENSKLNIKMRDAREIFVNAKDLEKTTEEKQMTLHAEKVEFEQEKVAFHKIKEELLNEKASFEKDKQEFSAEKESSDRTLRNLLARQELLEQEKKRLGEEKASLDKMSLIFDASERTLKIENKRLEKKYEQAIKDFKALEEETAKIKIDLNNTKEENELLKAQSDIYKMDYQEERTAAQNYKQQVQELQQLLQEARNNQQRRSVSSDGEQNLGTTQNQEVDRTYKCPKCQCQFLTLEPLEHHVVACLNLQ